ncbi:MAG TPA: ATP-binding protein [Polyangiaceae bacterium]
MTLTFRAKLLASHLALVTAILVLVVLELNRTLGDDLVRQLDDRLEQQAAGAATWVGEGRRHPEKLAGRLGLVTHAQVTIFDREGDVIGDSEVTDVAHAANGSGNPEIVAAQAGDVGRATRILAGVPTRFVAVAAGDGMVLRLAVPLSDIDATLRGIRGRLSVAFAVAFAAALALGWLASRLAARPLRAMTESATRIARGDYAIVPSTSPDDFGVLSRTLASLGSQLETKLGELTAERDRVSKLLVVRRDFVANSSHELRTPVTAIQGYAETLLGSSVDEPTRRQFVEIIHRHSLRLAALVEDLLELSELEARPPEQTVRERVEVSGIAEHVRDTLRERATQRGATVDVAIAPDAAISGDPTGLEQVLENLTDNAIKYGRDSGGHVRVTGDRRGDRVVLEVSDDGPGIAPEHLPRLFERFYRVDAGRSREQGGTGLGLAIVKHLVESMGGTIAVSSAPGTGTRFTVELPASAG